MFGAAVRSGVGAVDGAASVGTDTSTIVPSFFRGVEMKMQSWFSLALLFSRFSCVPDFFHARQTSFQNCVYDSAKTTATIAHVYGVGYCCFCLKISLLIAAMDLGHIRLRRDYLFCKINKAVQENKSAQQYYLQGTLPMSSLSFYQYHESVCLCWRIRRV